MKLPTTKKQSKRVAKTQRKSTPHKKTKRNMSTSKNAHRFVIQGGAGSGKGTLSKKLVKDFGFAHISTGDLLRKEIKDNTPLGQQASGFITKGELVPDEVVINMVEKEVSKIDGAPILLDGFPRTLPQAVALDKVMKVTKVLNLNVPDEEIIARISSRWTHLPSGRVYAYDFNPPKNIGFDDETGEPLIQRADDTAEAVKQRLATYWEKTQPLISYYEDKGILTSYDGSNAPEIVAKGRRSDAIYLKMKEDVQQVFDSSV